MNMDFPERIIDDKKEDFVEDRQFRLKVDKSMKFIDGHYQLGLPFRDATKQQVSGNTETCQPKEEAREKQRLQE